jgi:beta-galactosidase
MTIHPFSADWIVGRPTGAFSMTGGGAGRSSVGLPHDALRDEARDPAVPARGAGGYFPSGAFSYEKVFEVPEDWRGCLVRLEIQGAYRRAQVFVNEELAGNRADGYARFFVDITPFLSFGEQNRVRVEVRSGEDSRWYSGAGLHRPVLLHVDAAVHIVPDGVLVRTLRIEDEQAVLAVETEVTNAGMNTRTVRVATVIADASANAVEGDETPVTLAPGERCTVRQVLYVTTPRLWSVDEPTLYSASVRIAGEESVTQVNFGIRTITVDPKHGLRINGQSVLLRGACVHHDNGPLGAAAVRRAEERRVGLLKEAGFNAIRSSHNPASVAMLDAADRLGMLVIDEAFDMWTKFKTPFDYAADFPQWWDQDLESMVRKDRNHPSVIMYSIGNEISEVGTPHGARWARRLAEFVRALDPSRPVTNGVNAMLAIADEIPQLIEEAGGLNAAMASGDFFDGIGASESATIRTEESNSVLDVVGLNYGDVRYRSDAELFPHRVIVGSETFTPQIGRLWPMVLESPNVIGDFCWTGWDYLGEAGIGAPSYVGDAEASGQLEREYPYLTAWTGDLDITGWRRPSSFYREIVFGLRAEPYIAVQRPERHGASIAFPTPWAWTDTISSWSWRGHEGAPVTVEVYTDADEVTLLLDGVELDRARVGAERPYTAVFETAYAPGTLTAVARRADGSSGTTEIVTAGPPTLTVRVDRDRLFDDGEDLAFLAIELRDADGQLVTDDDRAVTVVVHGSGELAGMCSANPRTEERFASSTWNTFDGRALAVVRPTDPGSIEIAVTCDGLDPVDLTLIVVTDGRPGEGPAHV